MTSTEQVRSDFDEIARLAESGASGRDRYDALLLSLIPATATHVLDVGCGLGRLTWAIATSGRYVVGVDLSPAMVDRARGLTSEWSRRAVDLGLYLVPVRFTVSPKKR
jgi:SAM-dependent methyltransferase